MSKLTISNDFRVYLSNDNPQLKAFEAFEANYVKSDSATLVVEATQGDLFTPEGLRLLSTLTEQAWQVPYSYRVSSLSNFTYSFSRDDDIFSQPLVEDVERLDTQSALAIRKTALSQKRLVDSLLTKDGKLSVVVINLNLPDNIPDASIRVTEFIENLLVDIRKQYPNFNIQNGGSTGFNTTLARAVKSDLSTLVPISYLLIFVGLLFFLRSLSSTFTVFILISACLLATFGFFGWVSPVLTPVAGFAPSILVSIMIADSVHIISIFLQKANTDLSKTEAIKASIQANLTPVIVTSLTTMIGFLSLNFSTSPPYRDLGNMVAFGVFIAMLFSLVLLPSLLQILPFKRRTLAHVRHQQSFTSSFADFIIKYKLMTFATLLLCFLALTFFVGKNRLSDNWANYFDDSFPVIKLVKKVDGYLTGINSLEYSIKAKPIDSVGEKKASIFDPDYLQELEEFEQWFRQQDKVFNVTSFSQLMKDLNQVMNGDHPSAYRLPKDSQLAAQYLFFYEIGLPEGLGLNNLLTIHQDASRFSVSVTNAGSDELLALDRRAQAWLKKNTKQLDWQPATGLGMVFAHIAERNIEGLLIGTFVALLGISLVLMLILKSFKYGVVSLIPNIVPAFMAYGVWGLAFGYIDISLSIVACATLGIVVDDTVHFLHKYQLARKAGAHAEAAIKIAFEKVGMALITTTLVLSGGFLILAVSPMHTSAAIGLLMAITLVFALIVDFFLLPPLLLYLDRCDKTVPVDPSAPK